MRPTGCRRECREPGQGVLLDGLKSAGVRIGTRPHAAWLGLFSDQWAGRARPSWLPAAKRTPCVPPVRGVESGHRGHSWEKNRFAAPYLRDDLLDAGYLVETLETANGVVGLQATYDAVHAALRGVRGTVDRHPSLAHLPTGLPALFTVIWSLWVTTWSRSGSRPSGPRPMHWWPPTPLITTTIGGRDHAPWLGAEIGDSAWSCCARSRAHLDPQVIMNQGSARSRESACACGPRRSQRATHHQSENRCAVC